ncbi:beta-xylosidase [Parablautia intestinalis]|uniref:Beta-xylosidase n=1 Tax=Parablautia intestinalis TaxID=2320100 RepID=A0A3A9B305_9FIRM|nr:beta-xylosidase [Parablautia intestinalis]RKI94123.1 beta-xylosidase [Parablautia intestinalis]
MNMELEIRMEDKTDSDRELKHYWSECIGAGRAKEALRADWQQQFSEAVKQFGIKYVRFHGVFHDDMFVYRDSYGSGFGPDVKLPEVLYTFSYVDKVYDFILSRGVYPFVELGFMPTGIATQPNTLFWWRANCCPPTDMNKWCELVERTVAHWVERYGVECVRKWRFEVWNEPNLVPYFWTGTRKQYFELYDATVRVIKKIDDKLMVGGPSTSVFVPDDRYKGETEDRSVEAATAQAQDYDALNWQPVWIREFLDFCRQRELPVDFLTTHLYPTDNAFGANGEMVGISRHADATYEDLLKLNNIIKESSYPNAELHITEWSHSPSSRDFMHDTVYAAVYIVRAYLKSIGLTDSMSYWTFSDIFEEGGAGIGAFHGGFGMINEQGIHKPVYHAFRMMERLGDKILHISERGIVTTGKESGSAAGIFFHYPNELNGKGIGSSENYAGTLRLSEVGKPIQIHQVIEGLKPKAQYAVETLDMDHGNVLKQWHDLGEPLNLSQEQEKFLKKVADELKIQFFQADEKGRLEFVSELKPWSIVSFYQL